MSTYLENLDKARAQLLDSMDDTGSPSAELLSSWQRSRAVLGVPASLRDVPQVSEDLLDQQLLEMFRAPVQRFAETFNGTGLGLLLSDAGGRVLERWATDRPSMMHFDKIGTIRGAVLSEEAVGTNGLGTALTLNRLVQVKGPEHFAEFFSKAICTGAPIIHPVSGQVLGSLCISCDLTPKSEFLMPLVGTMVQQLEQHVVNLEAPSSRRALDAFLHASSTRNEPTVAIGPNGFLIQNALASRLSQSQLLEIRELCADVREGDEVRIVTSDRLALDIRTLDAGYQVVAVVGHTPNTISSVAVEAAPRTVALVGRTPEYLEALQDIARMRVDHFPAVVAGEPGVGKVSSALGVPLGSPSAPPAGVAIIRASDAHLTDRRTWLRAVSLAMETSRRVVVRNAETLEAAELSALRGLSESRGEPGRLVLTMTTFDRGEADALAVRMGRARAAWIPALRERAGDLSDLWNGFARLAAPSAAMVLRPEAAALLRTYDWPGNLSELRSLVLEISRRERSGFVSTDELPQRLRSSASGMSLIQQVEVRALRQALAEADGNRAKAAEILGMSKATVYRKIKVYRLV